MPNTRKKIIKTVYKNEDDSDVEEAFSDSGSEANISEQSSSEDAGEEHDASSGEEFKKIKKPNKTYAARKPKFTKSLINKINKQTYAGIDHENSDVSPALFSIKDLTEEDKLLPSILNLSESDSSDDESTKPVQKKNTTSILPQSLDVDSDNDNKTEYKDVWSYNQKDESEEIARKTFLELEQHKSLIDETKASFNKYTNNLQKDSEFNVNDLLAQGEELITQKKPLQKKSRLKKVKDDSESDMDDWEEVKETKAIPQQGLQLIVDLPNTVSRKTKKVDVEMMMKRKLNRVKKEYQVYMHKVHVLCWLGHGNYVSKILNDQDVLAAVLSLVPSKECYPGARVDMKYVEQITTWYKDKLTLKHDKNENKFRPKAPALKDILIGQIKCRSVKAKKFLVYIFVGMLRALGLQCRIMFNFVTLPIRPPSSELCSLSIKPKDDKNKPKSATKPEDKKTLTKKKVNSKKSQSREKIAQVDGADDELYNSYQYFTNIDQLDGSNEPLSVQTRSTRLRKPKATNSNTNTTEDVSPPKRSRKSPSPKPSKSTTKINKEEKLPSKAKVIEKTDAQSTTTSKSKVTPKSALAKTNLTKDSNTDEVNDETIKDIVSPRKTRSHISETSNVSKGNLTQKTKKDTKLKPPKIVITTDKDSQSTSKYFENKEKSEESSSTQLKTTRKRSKTTTPNDTQTVKDRKEQTRKPVKSRTKSAPATNVEESKYFKDTETTPSQSKKPRLSLTKPKPVKDNDDTKRVSHRDLAKSKPKDNKIDVTGDLVSLIKGRIREAKEETKKKIVKDKFKKESDDDSDFLPEEDVKNLSDSDDDFKPAKLLSPQPSTSKKIDRRVLSSDDDTPKNKVDVWCEVFVEELEQWVSVDVVKGKVHCAEAIYTGATHPVCYAVGWDNNNYLKDLTRRYVPHWNTVTRKQRAEPRWWDTAVQPWLGPKNARDKEEDEQLDRMQLEAPLPKSIAEYKNHPLYALKRHLLKYEALYPSNAAVLGFVRGEAVYARECVHVCRSRDTWLKEAKVVRLGEEPYKIVKPRPKWDKVSNKIYIPDIPLEIFGIWQVKDYEPPTAEFGLVPRNAYGNVELFKECMLPKGTAHIKLPGLNKIAKKLNIDCAPAMTGFDFNGGWSHPVYDGFVVCKEFEEIITEAWVEDQEEQERKEREKIDARVFGHWRRLIKGLLIRERLKLKYGFEEPSTSQDKKKSKGPRLVVKKT